MRATLFVLTAVFLRAQSVLVTGTAQPIPLDEADRSVHVLENPPQKSLLFGGFFEFLQLDSSVDLQQRGSRRAGRYLYPWRHVRPDTGY